jgi:hypothetical protein
MAKKMGKAPVSKTGKRRFKPFYPKYLNNENIIIFIIRSGIYLDKFFLFLDTLWY